MALCAERQARRLTIVTGEDLNEPGSKRQVQALRALRHRDFRWLWVGAFLSFTGSAVQNVAQQQVVLDQTGSTLKLSMVAFAMMLPVSLLGPILGVAADMFDKRKLLVACMALSSVGPLALSVSMVTSSIQYWMFLAVAALAGLIQCVEVPTRQSIVRAVVDEKDLAAAIPTQAATFNLARIIGPVVAAGLLRAGSPALCFLANGLSFSALALAAWRIKADLRPVVSRVEPVKDLVKEGFVYTFRQPTLRTLFFLEAATAVFGAFYLSQMSAITKQQLGLGVDGTAAAFTCVGVGALAGLVTTASMSSKPIKTTLVKCAMTGLALCLLALSLAREPMVAYVLFALTGAGTIMHFNVTNTLMQLVSPPNLRGRVISMHMWAISGVAPIGVVLFGWVSERFGIPVSFQIAGACLLLLAVWGWTQGKHLVEPSIGD